MNFLNSTLARVLIVLPAVMNGMGHFTQTDGYAGAVPKWLPAPHFWVYFTGACLLAASVGIIFRMKDKLAAYLLALLIATFAFTVHFPGMSAPLDAANPNAGMMKMFAMAMFFKDLGLAGGALLIGITSKSSKKG